MIQKVYQKAMKFAGEKHCDQFVPGTKANYLLHLSNVAMEILVAHNEEPNFNLEYAVQVAILHDTVEDTKTSYKELVKNFDTQIADGVMALTKDDSINTKDEKLLDSISKIKKQPKEVALVKLADRITNLQPPPSTWNKEKVIRYKDGANIIADELKGFNDYLDKRIRKMIFEYGTNEK